MNHPTRAQFDQVMVPTYAPANIIPVRGKGSYLWDQDGQEYIDLAGGIAVTALGHGHPALLKALQTQSQKLWHLSNVMTNEPAIELASRLTELTFADQVFFCNSGAEANEAALKLARRHAYLTHGPDKHEIVSTLNSFHGRTLFTVSVGGQAQYKEGFEPTPAGISHVPFNDLDAMAARISQKTAAVIVEPIQGEGGVTPASQHYLQGLRTLCDQHQALLIFDEIQCGVGRTGSLYAYEQFETVPDVLTSAKALGCGFPIGAMLTSCHLAQSLSVGTHGTTYGGNPLACAVSSAVLQEITKPGVLTAVQVKGQRLRQALAVINQEFDLFQDIRGMGLLMGAELKGAWRGRAKEFVAQALEAGVFILVAGPNVLRFAPSLLIEDTTLDEGLKRLQQAIQRLVEKAS